MSSPQFFRELENFLPVHVPVFPSYVHSTLVFLIAVVSGHLVSKKSKATFDLDSDGVESETEKKMRVFIQRGITVVVALFLADLTFNVSWKLRNKVNRKHLVYSRWFPKLYT